MSKQAKEVVTWYTNCISELISPSALTTTRCVLLVVVILRILERVRGTKVTGCSITAVADWVYLPSRPERTGIYPYIPLIQGDSIQSCIIKLRLQICPGQGEHIPIRGPHFL